MASLHLQGTDITEASQGKIPVVDGCILMQGPNYCLAKTMQQWRGIVARDEGVVVSANLAPPCRSVSVVRNPTVVAALEGMAFFEPMAAFEPKTASAIMTSLMLWDLFFDESAANPATKLSNPTQLFVQNAFHGGGWRCAYNTDSTGIIGYGIGRVATGLFGYKFNL
jgi:hypothetical protein